MDEQALFASLQKQKRSVLLDYLHAAFDGMTAEQREDVFADAIPKPMKKAVDGEDLQLAIDEFRRESLARAYYAPFDMNSKNFRHIPERTQEWCRLFAGF